MKTKNQTSTKTLAVVCAVASLFLAGQVAVGAQAPVALGSSAEFAVLAGTRVTSTGNTTIHGNLGVSPGTALTGFPPSEIVGVIHLGDPIAAQAQADLTIAYNDAAGRILPPDQLYLAGNIGGQTLPPGLYKSTSSLAISSGDPTLDAGGNTNAVFIFQMASTLTTTSGRKVILTGGAKSAKVFWQVGSSATLGTTSVFKGSILAQESITLETGATLEGRALARVGAVTLDACQITLPSAKPLPPSFGPLVRATDGTMTLSIVNTPDLALTVQYSIDLQVWTTLSTSIPNVSPYVTTDTTASPQAKRFYRAFYP